jgi:sugar (pentulose or hexulose) kinase
VRVAAIGVAGQMHGDVLCAGDGVPLQPAVLWPDQRAAGVLARSDSTAGWSSLTTSTGRADLARSAFEAFAFTIATESTCSVDTRARR